MVERQSGWQLRIFFLEIHTRALGGSRDGACGGRDGFETKFQLPGRNNGTTLLALTKATLVWIWTFVVERTVRVETAQAEEKRVEALNLLALRKVVGRFVIVSRAPVLLQPVGREGRLGKTSPNRGRFGSGTAHPRCSRRHEIWCVGRD